MTESINWTFLASLHNLETGSSENVSIGGGGGPHALAQALGLFVRLLRASGYAIDTEQMTYRDIPFEDWAADPEDAVYRANDDMLERSEEAVAAPVTMPSAPFAGGYSAMRPSGYSIPIHQHDED